jgi:hypothetical protein
MLLIVVFDQSNYVTVILYHLYHYVSEVYKHASDSKPPYVKLLLLRQIRSLLYLTLVLLVPKPLENGT